MYRTSNVKRVCDRDLKVKKMAKQDGKQDLNNNDDEGPISLQNQTFEFTGPKTSKLEYLYRFY